MICSKLYNLLGGSHEAGDYIIEFQNTKKK